MLTERELSATQLAHLIHAFPPLISLPRALPWQLPPMLPSMLLLRWKVCKSLAVTSSVYAPPPNPLNNRAHALTVQICNTSGLSDCTTVAANTALYFFLARFRR
jgi:hypothetical protein